MFYAWQSEGERNRIVETTQTSNAQEGREPPTPLPTDSYLPGATKIPLSIECLLPREFTWKYCFQTSPKNDPKVYEARSAQGLFVLFFLPRRFRNVSKQSAAKETEEFGRWFRCTWMLLLERRASPPPLPFSSLPTCGKRELFLRRRPLTLDVTSRVNTTLNPCLRRNIYLLPALSRSPSY